MKSALQSSAVKMVGRISCALVQPAPLFCGASAFGGVSTLPSLKELCRAIIWLSLSAVRQNYPYLKILRYSSSRQIPLYLLPRPSPVLLHRLRKVPNFANRHRLVLCTFYLRYAAAVHRAYQLYRKTPINLYFRRGQIRTYCSYPQLWTSNEV
ncbi:hypothetical protein DL95DRAFT_164266 [Leptodontidium sp. 2 PMI_412]|nr:hypothetical protein DL95DRAFT_164266 [Leptodontidium sp. 2 PMI_412]